MTVDTLQMLQLLLAMSRADVDVDVATVPDWC